MKYAIGGKIVDTENANVIKGARACYITAKAYIKKCFILGVDPEAKIQYSNFYKVVKSVKLRNRKSNIACPNLVEEVKLVKKAKEVAPKSKALEVKAPIKKTTWVEKTEKLLNCNFPVLLVGPTGCGKTYNVLEYAKENNYNIYRVNFDAGMTSEDFIGATKIKSVDGVSVTYFQKGPVVQALEDERGLLLLDEIDRIPPEYACALHSLLEAEKKEFVVNANGGQKIKINPNLKIVATANCIYNGVDQTSYNSFAMGKALLNRFVVVECAYDMESILGHYSNNTAVIKKLVKWQKETQRRGNSDDISMRSCIQYLQCIDILGEAEALDSCFLYKTDLDTRQVLKEIWSML